MPARIKPTWEGHKRQWSQCTRCKLGHTVKNVALLRGSIPAAVLFIGEAPGQSEDVLGKPFVGPAGQLLDQMISKAQIPRTEVAFTNLLGCLPLDETGIKVSNPGKHPEALKACQPRLPQLLQLVKPDLVVWVGKDAAKYGPTQAWQPSQSELPPTAFIIHPAAIMRMDVSQRGLAFQRTVIALRDAFTEYVIPF